MTYYSTCCDAPFQEPGWPDSDLCGSCHEHTGAWTDDPELCKHPKDVRIHQPEEKDTNVPERYYCEHCDSDLDMPEPDWDALAKEQSHG